MNAPFRITRLVTMALGIFAICLISAGIGAMLTQGVNVTYNDSLNLKYADVVTIVLAALSLMITLLAIVLAIFGVIGWNSIADRARQNTNDYLAEGFKNGNVLHDLLQKEVQRARFSGIQAISASPDGGISATDEIEEEGEA